MPCVLRCAWQLLNESPLSRLLWKAWEVQSGPEIITTRPDTTPNKSASLDPRSKAGSSQAQSRGSLGRLFHASRARDEPASEAGLSEQGLEPVKGSAGQVVFSDEHTEAFVEALPDAQDEGRPKGGPGGRGSTPDVDHEGAMAEAADVAAKHHVQTEGSPGEQDAPHVYSKRCTQNMRSMLSNTDKPTKIWNGTGGT